MNYHYDIAQDLTCTYNSLLGLFIIQINVSVIMKLMSPLAHYHTIYLIIKLIQINLMFIRLENYFYLY
jgi:hypothetical protein